MAQIVTTLSGGLTPTVDSVSQATEGEPCVIMVTLNPPPVIVVSIKESITAAEIYTALSYATGTGSTTTGYQMVKALNADEVDTLTRDIPAITGDMTIATAFETLVADMRARNEILKRILT